jgi:hypothetical protein
MLSDVVFYRLWLIVTAYQYSLAQNDIQLIAEVFMGAKMDDCKADLNWKANADVRTSWVGVLEEIALKNNVPPIL